MINSNETKTFNLEQVINHAKERENLHASKTFRIVDAFEFQGLLVTY